MYNYMFGGIDPLTPVDLLERLLATLPPFKDKIHASAA